MKEKAISVKTFNPYEYQYPNRKVLSVEAIHLVKELKQQGFSVDVLPDDPRPVDYVFRKGYKDIFNFALPFIITVWQELPKEIILSTISDWYKKRFFSPNDSKKIPKSVIDSVIYIENFSGKMYNLKSEQLSDQAITDKLIGTRNTQKAFKEAFLQKPIYIDLPTPIYSQHKPIVIGWAKLSLDEKGIRVDKSVITDQRTWKDVLAKKLKGFSVAGIATESTCNICNSSYVLCEHISGLIYDNQECYNSIQKALPAECSLVEIPSNSECVVEIITNQLKM